MAKRPPSLQRVIDEIYSRMLRPEAAVTVEVTLPPQPRYSGGRWDGGPVDLLVVARHLVGDNPAEALASWLMHVPNQGFVVLHGWAPRSHPAIAAVPVDCWQTPDSRAWVPIYYEGAAIAWRCEGPITDA